MATIIHPTAIVHEKAQIGADVQIGPYSIVGEHVVLGDRCHVGPHVVIEGRTKIGAETRIWQFASVGGPPQDLKFSNEPSELIIGSQNVIREYVTLQLGTARGHMRTVIGDGNMFMASSHVGHDCTVGSHNVFANSVALAGHVTVGNHVILGGLVAIHQFCRLGDYCFLSGGSMVGEDVPPYCVGDGDRAKLRGLNLVGLKRHGFTAEQLSDIKKAYRALLGSRGKISDKMAQLSPDFLERPHIRRLCDFISGSKRGICNPHKQLAMA